MCVELWTTRFFFHILKQHISFFSRFAEELSGVWMVAVWLHIKINHFLCSNATQNNEMGFLFLSVNAVVVRMQSLAIVSWLVSSSLFCIHMGFYNLKALKCDQSLFLLLYSLFTRTNIRMHVVVSLCISAVISMEIHFWFSNANL